MKKNLLFKGAATALVTPMTENSIDLFAFERLIVSQLKASVSAVVLFGTTGEPLSLSESEKKLLFFTAKEIIGNKIPIIAGISSTVTTQAVKSAKIFVMWGADALLVLTPYYYKCTDSGVIAHFTEICSATKAPVIVYNVPKRTAYDLNANKKVIEAFEKIDNIVGIKEAESNTAIACDFINSTTIPVYCGDDVNNFQMLCNKSSGSISVLSNVIPEKIVRLHNAYFDGKINDATRIDSDLKPWYKMLSLSPNPSAIKYATSKLFDFSSIFRLPITIPDNSACEYIDKLIFDYRLMKNKTI